MTYEGMYVILIFVWAIIMLIAFAIDEIKMRRGR